MLFPPGRSSGISTTLFRATSMILFLVIGALGPITGTFMTGSRTTSAAPVRSDAAPAEPSGVVAVADDGQVRVAWGANSDRDLRGYNVYRSSRLPVDTSSQPINGTKPLTINTITDTGLANGVTYYYAVEAVDAAGQRALAESVSAVPLASDGVVDARINFQDQNTVPPAGYWRDFGEPYNVRTGVNQGSGQSYGWVTFGTNTPLPGNGLVGNGRNRNTETTSANEPDLRLATLLHVQGAPTNAATGAWEFAVPDGAYTVSVSVGDAKAIDSSHSINIEGQSALVNFVPTASKKYASATKTVNVSDGRVTIDANGGTNTKINYVTIRTAVGGNRPSITGTTPQNGVVNVSRDSAVVATVNLPTVGAGVDGTTLKAANLKLFRTNDGVPVNANGSTSGGGDIIVLQPTTLLEPNTSYTFQVTEGVKDTSGAAFVPYTMTFSTGTSGGGAGGGVAFEQVPLPNTNGYPYSSVVIGPDGKLYAGTLMGDILRFPINADGKLGPADVITTLKTYTGSTVNRALIGMVFDPQSTATNPILWVSHNYWPFLSAPDWTGKITRLSGANLQNAQDYVINLPRSYKDHMTNSLAWGPDGKLYVVQGSNTATGERDSTWGDRPERILTGAVLRVDPAKITQPPLDVKTEEGGSYNPFAAGAAVTIYATGVRNAYDLVWHSNGQLYLATNGSAAGGNTPATPSTLPASCQNRIDKAANGVYSGPTNVPALTSSTGGIENKVPTQDDFLFRIVENGYYGHPNALRCEWVMNGGNPTNAVDKAEVVPDSTGQIAYPVGVKPDRNYRGFAFNFQNNKSPNGAIEYQSNTFGGALKGKLLVVRYSAGKDIIVLTPGGENLDIIGSKTGIPGFTGFIDPLDLIENTTNGSIYVTELIGHQPGSEDGRITLLRPVTSSNTPNVTTDATRLIFNDISSDRSGGSGPSATQNVRITNIGNATLTVNSASLVGTDASQFQLVNPPAANTQLTPGSSLTVGVRFNPQSIGPKGAFLRITSDDPDTSQLDVPLRGLGTIGAGGDKEPSLQWILDTYQIKVTVGDPDPANNALPTTPLLGEEVSVPRFQKFGAGPVTIEPLAIFGPQSASGSVTSFGYYTSGNASSKQPLWSAANAQYQSLQPAVSGVTSFDPGTNVFGFYSIWPYFNNREVFSEDALNTWENTAANRHKVRVYPLKDANGVVIPAAYVVAMEETTSGFDYQDVVVIVRNVKPEGASGPDTPTPTPPAPTPVPPLPKRGWLPLVER